MFYFELRSGGSKEIGYNKDVHGRATREHLRLGQSDSRDTHSALEEMLLLVLDSDEEE